MRLKHISKIIVVVFIFATFLVQPVLAELSRSQISDIARATTVLIAPDLTAAQVAAAQEKAEAGSGVLIARQVDAKKSIAGDAKKSIADPNTYQYYRYWVLIPN